MQCASLPWLIIMLKFVFHLYLLEKKMLFLIMFSFFFFKLFIHSDCMGQGGPCSLEELNTVCNMDGLAYRFGSPSPSYLCPGGVWRGGCWTRKYCIGHLSPPLLRLRMWVGGGGCSHFPCRPAYYLCLGLG